MQTTLEKLIKTSQDALDKCVSNTEEERKKLARGEAERERAKRGEKEGKEGRREQKESRATDEADRRKQQTGQKLKECQSHCPNKQC